jgi:hypothetical protein
LLTSNDARSTRAVLNDNWLAKYRRNLLANCARDYVDSPAGR